LPAARAKMEQLTLRFGLETPEQLIDEVITLRNRCGLPENFKQWQLNTADFPFIVKNCRSGSMKSNPRPFSDEEVCTFLEKLI
jgi:alcohol dehydrogenase class IV